MPQAFENCRKKGGRVRTASGPNKHFNLKSGEYRPVCWLNGKPHWGEKHKKKSKD